MNADGACAYAKNAYAHGHTVRVKLTAKYSRHLGTAVWRTGLGNVDSTRVLSLSPRAGRDDSLARAFVFQTTTTDLN